MISRARGSWWKHLAKASPPTLNCPDDSWQVRFVDMWGPLWSTVGYDSWCLAIVTAKKSDDVKIRREWTCWKHQGSVVIGLYLSHCSILMNSRLSSEMCCAIYVVKKKKLYYVTYLFGHLMILVFKCASSSIVQLTI